MMFLSLRRCLSCLSVLVLIVGATARAQEPQADELVEARRWVAAKFQDGQPAAPLDQGLTILENYGPVQKNGRGDKALRIGDARYPRGMYCHAASRILVRSPQPVRALSATIGVDSNVETRPGRGSVVFSVTSDDRELFRSEELREGIAGVPVRIDLGGSREFLLRVEEGADGISCDQADWADAKLELENGESIWLDALAMLDASGPQLDDEPPFSFVYDGRPSSELLGSWTMSRESVVLDANRTQHVRTYTDSRSKLAVRCEAIAYREYPTVEWTVYLRNDGEVDSGLFESVQSLDIVVRRAPGSEFLLHHHRGDSCTPESYEPLTTVLEPGGRQQFAPSGGRPTTGAWPYWNVQWGMQGVLVALGWPGQWAAEFVRDDGDALRVRGGQELTRFVLHPGEEVRTPLAVLQFYRGTTVRAQNVWRRWMLAHNLPQTKERTLAPILSSCSGGFFPGLRCNETDELRFLDAYAQNGIRWDFWWMDAGWYPCDSWQQVGTWEVDKSRFPRGLKPISDRAHSLGGQLILWFEPERVTPGTWLYDSHPDWMLGQDGDTKLLNLGHPAAREWLTQHVDEFLTREGIDLYRQDFNIDPLPYWRAADANDRQGITEIRYVEGYLAYWDQLRRSHPGMLIDSCASGGRRNDLETMRRAIPLLRSDYQSFAGDIEYAMGNQCHTYGLSSWLPFYGQGVYYNSEELVYNVRSHFCPAFGFCSDVRREGTDWAQFRKLVEDWRAVSPSFLGDFYPLTPYSLDDDVWVAWQFHRPETNEGVVQVFRRSKSVYTGVQLKLHGLDPDKLYVVTDRDAGDSVTMTGRELMEAGLPVTSDHQPAAILIQYFPYSSANSLNIINRCGDAPGATEHADERM